MGGSNSARSRKWVRIGWAAIASFHMAASAGLIDVETKTKPTDAAWRPRPTQILSRLDGYAAQGPRSLDR